MWRRSKDVRVSQRLGIAHDGNDAIARARILHLDAMRFRHHFGKYNNQSERMPEKMRVTKMKLRSDDREMLYYCDDDT